jgi:hypothetical protein
MLGWLSQVMRLDCVAHVRCSCCVHVRLPMLRVCMSGGTTCVICTECVRVCASVWACAGQRHSGRSTRSGRPQWEVPRRKQLGKQPDEAMPSSRGMRGPPSGRAQEGRRQPRARMTRPLAWGGGRACDLLDICNPSGSWHRRNSLQCLPYRHKTGLPGVWPGGRPATCFVLVGCWKTNTVHRKKQQSTHDTRQRMAWPLHLPKPIANNTAHRKPKASSLSKGRAAN